MMLLVGAIGSCPVLLSGCKDGGNTTVKCSRDSDCPDGQQCVGGNCQVPGDPGPKTCQNSNDCPIGYVCDDGICQPYNTEPAEEADAGTQDGGDQQMADGDQSETDQGPDEDIRDFSNLNFTVAVARGGTSGPATQCVNNVRPPSNQGAVLPDVTLAAGFVLSGSAGSPGAQVSLLADRQECVPAPVTSDGSSNYAFYIPSGSYNLQVVAANGLTAHERGINLSSTTTKNISLPTTTDLNGGPLSDSGVDLNGWTVMAYYRNTALANLLAHNGVLTGTVVDGEFVIPLPSAGGSERYDLLGYPQAGADFPLQILYEDVDPAGPDLSAHGVREGGTLMGAITTSGGLGAPGCMITVENTLDARLKMTASSGTNGAYQVLIRPAKRWKVAVIPSGAAFGLGAASYVHPDLFIATDLTADIELAQAEQVVFTGKLIDAGGGGVGDAQVRLLINQAYLAEDDYSLCDPSPVTTDANGVFQITCNLLP